MASALHARPAFDQDSSGCGTSAEQLSVGPGIRVTGFLPLLLAAAVAIAIQSLWLPLDSDVSWLITVSERVLAGERLYVDVIEVNPPASVWLYVPLVWLGQAANIRIEAVVGGAFVLAGLASAVATVKVASGIRGAPAAPTLLGIVGFVGLVLPMGLFAQREHAALLLALPSVAMLARIADGAPRNPRALLLAGLAAGLVIVIKPYLALAILAPATWVAIKRRDARTLLTPACAAAATVLVYALLVAACTPAYFDWIPVFADTYLNIKASPAQLAISAIVFIAAALLPLLVLWPARLSSLTIVWSLAALGFALAGALQAKSYANHWLPGAALALAAAMAAVASPYARDRMQALAATLLALVVLWQLPQWTFRPDPAVANAVRRVAPPRPTMMALSRELSSGHPVTRNVGGRWVGSRAALYTAAASRDKGLDQPFTRDSYLRDISAFADDVRTHAPDVILVDRPDKHWLMGEHAVSVAFADYRRAETVGNTEIWLRY